MSKSSGTNSPIASDVKDCFFSLYTIYAASEAKDSGAVKKEELMVVIATGIHLYPYRTEKLSPLAPMVLLYQVGE